MSTRDHRKNHSQQAGIRLSVKLFVLALLVAPIMFLASAGQAQSLEAAETDGASIWLDGPTQAALGQTIS